MTESFFETWEAAYEEAARIRQLENEVFVKVERSPYGGYRLRVVPADIAMELLDISPFSLGQEYRG